MHEVMCDFCGLYSPEADRFFRCLECGHISCTECSGEGIFCPDCGYI